MVKISDEDEKPPNVEIVAQPEKLPPGDRRAFVSETPAEGRLVAPEDVGMNRSDGDRNLTIAAVSETPPSEPYADGVVDGFRKPGGACGALLFPHLTDPDEMRAKLAPLLTPKSFLRPRECPTCGAFREAHELERNRCTVAVEYGLAKPAPVITKTPGVTGV